MSTPAFSGESGHAGAEAAWLDAHFGACAPEYRAMLEWAGIRPGDHVLDLGCGSGAFLPWIAELTGKNGRVTAIDLSIENLGRALATIDALPATAGAVAADSLHLPLREQSFDAVWCANAFEYLTADERVACLREMTRVLRPGGLIAVKDSEFAHKIFEPAPLTFWYRFMQHLADAGGGPYVGRTLPGAFKRSGLSPNFRTFPTERSAPLTAIERRWISLSGRAIAADAERFMGLAGAEDAAAFARLFDESSGDCILDRDEFYYSEASIVVVARTPR